jgi:hypothetical protein
MSKSRIAFALSVLALGFILGFAANTPLASLSSRASAIAEAQASGKQRPQRMWEHRVVDSSIYASDDALESELNKLGREGFEVCGMTATQDRRLLIALRRPGR